MVYSPMLAPYALGRLATAAVVYDCMDELANFRFACADLAQREQYLLAQCVCPIHFGPRVVIGRPSSSTSICPSEG
jgi:hypothetical protein